MRGKKGRRLKPKSQAAQPSLTSRQRKVGWHSPIAVVNETGTSRQIKTTTPTTDGDEDNNYLPSILSMPKSKKDRRAKSSAAAGSDARNQNGAKQTESESEILQSPLSDSQDSIFSFRRILPLLVFVAIAAIDVLVIIARTDDEDDGNDTRAHDDLHITATDDHIPRIDGMDIGQESWGKTKDFLDNFVCNYHPSTESNGIVDTEGYCHPKLSAVPQHRAQEVSFSQSPASINGSEAIPILKEIKKGWAKVLQYISGTRISAINVGISAGELVTKVPRPLQIWDLDALRDKFIQQEFLGLGTKNEGANIVRHKDTQNPLDSGAFLAVHLLRLLHGSQSDKTSYSVDANSNDQCHNESEECRVVLRWGDLGQYKRRVETLSDYLDILPTAEDRIAQQPNPKPNPHSHPLFLAESLLQSLFPKGTHTYNLIRHYQLMVRSEYDSLKSTSREFGDNVHYFDYLGMRINVLSRAVALSISANDNGARWSASNDLNGASLLDEMKSYETSNFGSFLESDGVVKDIKLRSMCPLLDMYDSHPNPYVSWDYDAKSSSFVVRANSDENIPPGHSIVISYGQYPEGHLYTKFGYVNGDRSLPTEISLAVFHSIHGDVGLGRQYLSQLSFKSTFDERNVQETPQVRKILEAGKKILAAQAKDLLRYLMFDDGYKECIDLRNGSRSRDGELKLLKLRHLILMANHHDLWIVRLPPKSTDTAPRPLDTMAIDSTKPSKEKKFHRRNQVAVNADNIVAVCRLLSLRSDDINGKAVEYLRDGLSSVSSSENHFFFVERHDDALEYRSMMCVVRLCNAALHLYRGLSNDEPEVAGSREWNAWYIREGELRALGIVQQTAYNEANKFRGIAKLSTDAAYSLREKGACHLDYSTPLLSRL